MGGRLFTKMNQAYAILSDKYLKKINMINRVMEILHTIKFLVNVLLIFNKILFQQMILEIVK
jgi:hypothetical protein